MRALLVGAAVLIVDRLTKWLVTASLVEGETVPVLPHFFHLTLVHNTGAAFGILRGATSLFIAVALVVIIGLALVLATGSRTGRRGPPSAALGLLLGGATGNLMDRARLGYVIDFLDFRIWPVFNVGDSAITIGVGWLVLHLLVRRRRS